MPNRSSSAVLRALCALFALVALMLVSAGPASAVTFSASPASLGPIPDSPAGGNLCGDYTAAPRDVTFTVTGVPSAPSNVEVGFSMETISGAGPGHPFVGDLDVTLLAPGGAPTKPILFQTGSTTATGCGSGANALGPYFFSDTAPLAPTWWQAAAANPSGTIPAAFYRASTPGGVVGGGANTLITPAFAGIPTSNGTWTLRFRDGGQGDVAKVVGASLALVPSPVLTVTKGGAGHGVVSGVGISCGVACTGTYAKGTAVTLTATPDAGSTFATWTGCDSVSGNQCTLGMNGDRLASAAFDAIPAQPGTQARKPDTTAPETTLGKHPKAVTSSHKARFTFSSSEPGSSFLCKLDKGAFKACTSPFKKTVAAGKHSFKVKAVDTSGNADATPAKSKFKVVD